MKIKLPKNLMKGLKAFGMVLGISLLTYQVDAVLKNNLPTSTISDEFPASYQTYINKLKEIYPNATFKAVYTGLDWNVALKHESYEVNKRISTVPKSYSAVWKMNGEDIKIDGSFVAASKSAVAYVLDPRNSLYEKRIFQFEGLTYNENVGIEVIDKVIASSPMVGTYSKKYKNAGVWVDMDLSYAEIIDKVGKETKVSSVYIASRMIQETSGDIVNNGSINGSNATYPGVYNFFNIGSTPNADGSGSVLNGLKHAKSKGWTTPYLSILGGVTRIKSTYIDYGQNTVYFQKFDVNNPGNATALMYYQYQTNIMAPISESIISYGAYKKLDMLDTAFVFYIPVYNNMPEEPTPYPAGDNATFETDNTKVYIEDPDGTGVNVRLSANTELDNIICTIKETATNPDDKLIMTRIKKGNGYDWDLVEFKKDGKTIRGYIWSDYLKVYEYTKVESVSLDKELAELEEGQTLTLQAIVNPEGARFKEVVWTSSNESILTVENGVITAKAPGEATVTATTEDQNKTATCIVMVKEKTHDITTDKEEYTVEQGSTLAPVVTLKNIQDYELKVENENIAKVTEKTIEALTVGETTIQIKGVGIDMFKTVKLIVTEKEYKIETDKEEYIVEEGSTLTPVVTLKNIDDYELKVENENIAKVTEKTIEALAVGETTIEIKGVGTEIVKTIKLIVKEKTYAINTDKEEYVVIVGKTVTPVVTLINIENYAMELLDAAIASVEENCIKGVAVGTTTLKIKAVERDIVKEVKITVISQEEYKLNEALKLDETTKIVTGNNAQTTVASVKEKIELTNLNIEFKNAAGKVLTDVEYIGTGTTITFLKNDGSEYDKLTLVIYGDVDGDGNIFAADYVKIKNYIMSEGELTEMGKIAADVSRDTFVYANDYVLVKNYIMGEGTISQ